MVISSKVHLISQTLLFLLNFTILGLERHTLHKVELQILGNSVRIIWVLMRWMKLEAIIQSEVSQKEKHQYSILTHIYGI